MAAQTAPLPSLLSIHEATNVLGISRSTLYAIIRSGDLETVEIRGRRFVEPATLKRYIARNRRRGRAEGP